MRLKLITAGLLLSCQAFSYDCNLSLHMGKEDDVLEVNLDDSRVHRFPVGKEDRGLFYISHYKGKTGVHLHVFRSTGAFSGILRTYVKKGEPISAVSLMRDGHTIAEISCGKDEEKYPSLPMEGRALKKLDVPRALPKFLRKNH